MKAGLNSHSFSISANSRSVPVPFSGGSTSNENCFCAESPLIMFATAIVFAHLGAKIRKNNGIHAKIPLFSLSLVFLDPRNHFLMRYRRNDMAGTSSVSTEFFFPASTCEVPLTG